MEAHHLPARHRRLLLPVLVGLFLAIPAMAVADHVFTATPPGGRQRQRSTAFLMMNSYPLNETTWRVTFASLLGARNVTVGVYAPCLAVGP